MLQLKKTSQLRRSIGDPSVGCRSEEGDGGSGKCFHSDNDLVVANKGEI